VNFVLNFKVNSLSLQGYPNSDAPS